ncbi:protein CutA homolog [Plutella xylostella]|uniref:protein CutA homolog n=1 Tax=Plutella xylostella TaxID=51655 RepID=UPI002032F111|nr:protein CutA homolog [Plutella xylostella]
MLIGLKRTSVLALYFSLFKPSSISAQFANMSSGSADADKYSVAYVTVPSAEVGKTLGHGLVKNKLAACVNIIPQVTSIYEWKGEINEDNEALLMIKTRTSEVDRLTEYVRSNHPYEVCEVISLPIKNGNPPYLKWIGENVKESQ